MRRAELEKYANSIGDEKCLLIYYNIAYLHFGCSQYKESIHWLNRIINEVEPTIRKDLQRFTQILRMLAYYELGEYDLLDSVIKSVYRYLRKQEKLFDFEKVIMRYIQQLSMNNEANESKIFIQFRQELDSCLQDSDEQKAVEYFDIHAWLESKISKKPFDLIIRQKAQSSMKPRAGFEQQSQK